MLKKGGAKTYTTVAIVKDGLSREREAREIKKKRSKTRSQTLKLVMYRIGRFEYSGVSLEVEVLRSSTRADPARKEFRREFYCTR